MVARAFAGSSSIVIPRRKAPRVLTPVSTVRNAEGVALSVLAIGFGACWLKFAVYGSI